MASKEIIKDDNVWQDLGDGVSRRILGWDKHIMMVKVKFTKGAVGSIHQHIHSQVTHCESGKFEFRIAQKKYVVEPGDALYFAPNIFHGCVCLEAGILIDVFSPAREDFL